MARVYSRSGQRVRRSNDPNGIYLVDDGVARRLPDDATHDGLFRDKTAILDAAVGDAMDMGTPLTAGAVLASTYGGGPMYLIEATGKRAIAGPAVVAAYGFDRGRAVALPASILATLPDGASIPPAAWLLDLAGRRVRIPSDSSVYLLDVLGGLVRRRIVDSETLDRLFGKAPPDVDPRCASIPEGPAVTAGAFLAKDPTANLYFVDNGAKRKVSAGAVQAWGFLAASAVPLPAFLVQAIPSGADIT